MKKLTALFLICLASVALPLGAIPVKVGVCIQPPLCFQEEAGQPPRGFFVDIFNDIARRHDWTVSYTVDSRANLMSKLARQEIDILMPIALPAGSSDKLDFSSSFLASHATLYVSPNTLLPSFHELQGKTIACVHDDVYSEPFLDYLKTSGIHFELIEMRSYEEVFSAIAAGRVDAGLADHLFGFLNSQNHDLAPTPTATASISRPDIPPYVWSPS